MDQVRIARFIDLQEAQIAAGLLQSHGLLVHLQNENLGAMDYLIRQAIGGFGLWVPEDQEAAAKAALAAVPDRPPDLDPEDEPVAEIPDGPGMKAVGAFAGAIAVLFYPIGWPVAVLLRRLGRLPPTVSANSVTVGIATTFAAMTALGVAILLLLILIALLAGHQSY